MSALISFPLCFAAMSAAGKKTSGISCFVSFSFSDISEDDSFGDDGDDDDDGNDDDDDDDDGEDLPLLCGTALLEYKRTGGPLNSFGRSDQFKPS